MDSVSRKSSAAFPTAAVIAGLLVVVMAALAYWGGLPSPEGMPKFLVGLALTLIVSGGIGFAAWHLLFRPMDAEVKPRSLLTPRQRQLVGAGLTVTMLAFAAGGAWDEVWHVKYGLPFGEDFLWRPHILLYIGFFGIIASAALGWLAMMRNARGTLAQRFRTDPTLGILVLVGIFTMFALPADPTWHEIFGEDISALSLPHLLLTLSLASGMIASVGVLLAGLPQRAWAGLNRLSLADAVPVVAFTTLLVTTFLLLTADWASLSVGNRDLDVVTKRPDWLLPAIVIALSSWIGVMANHSLRRYGVATLVGVLMLAVRLGLVTALDHTSRDLGTWAVALPTLMAIDLMFAFRRSRGESVGWQVAAVASLVSLIPLLLMVNRIYIYPQLSNGNLIFMLVVPALVAVIASWLGETVGDYLATKNRAPVPEAAQVSVTSGDVDTHKVSLAVLVPSLVFIVWFVVTAAPPV